MNNYWRLNALLLCVSVDSALLHGVMVFKCKMFAAGWEEGKQECVNWICENKVPKGLEKKKEEDKLAKKNCNILH